MIKPIDLLVVAITNWCGINDYPQIYTKESMEDCAVVIANCGIGSNGDIVDKHTLAKCRIKGTDLLVTLSSKKKREMVTQKESK